MSLIFGALCAFVTNSLASAGGRPVALVYRGVGSCDDGACSKAAAKVARAAGFTVRYVEAGEVFDEQTYRDAVVWVQPGGDAIEVAQTIGTDGLRAIAERVTNGLNYIGICAGAFLADRTVDDPETIPGLGLIPFSSYDYPARTQAPYILPITWNEGVRYMYFQGGPSFRVSPAEYPQYDLDVFATYRDGAVAGFSTRYGAGNVVLSAVHPEATDGWLEEEQISDPDGVDTDLAIELFDRAYRSAFRGR